VVARRRGWVIVEHQDVATGEPAATQPPYRASA
jgi:hypothetical protein